MENNLPSWANEMAEIFKSGSISQFLLYGNTDDWVTYKGEDSSLKRLSVLDSADTDFRDWLHPELPAAVAYYLQ